MNVSPTVAVAGAFVLLVVALIIFIVVLARSARGSRPGNGARLHPLNTAASGRVDTDLKGLEVSVAKDSPSAALLAPLRESEWMPPETPAPAEDLPTVHLDQRIAEYEPPIHVPEPEFSIEAYPEWHVPRTPAHAETTVSAETCRRVNCGA